MVLKKKLAECPDALKAQELSNALYGLNNLGDTEEVTEATWSGAKAAGVQSFRDQEIIRSRSVSHIVIAMWLATAKHWVSSRVIRPFGWGVYGRRFKPPCD